MPNRSDLQMRDSPAPAILRDNPEAFAGIDAASLKLAQDVLRVSKRVLGSFTDTFGAFDLSPGRYSVLMALYAAGALAPSEIAERLGVSRATVTGLITGLEKAGLTKLLPADDDRRRKAVVLTDDGRRLLQKVVPVIFRQMVALVGGLSVDDQTKLQSLLMLVEASISGATDVPPEKENDK